MVYPASSPKRLHTTVWDGLVKVANWDMHWLLVSFCYFFAQSPKVLWMGTLPVYIRMMVVALSFLMFGVSIHVLTCLARARGASTLVDAVVKGTGTQQHAWLSFLAFFLMLGQSAIMLSTLRKVFYQIAFRYDNALIGFFGALLGFAIGLLVCLFRHRKIMFTVSSIAFVPVVMYAVQKSFFSLSHPFSCTIFSHDGSFTRIENVCSELFPLMGFVLMSLFTGFLSVPSLHQLSKSSTTNVGASWKIAGSCALGFVLYCTGFSMTNFYTPSNDFHIAKFFYPDELSGKGYLSITGFFYHVFLMMAVCMTLEKAYDCIKPLLDRTMDNPFFLRIAPIRVALLFMAVIGLSRIFSVLLFASVRVSIGLALVVGTVLFFLVPSGVDLERHGRLCRSAVSRLLSGTMHGTMLGLGLVLFIAGVFGINYDCWPFTPEDMLFEVWRCIQTTLCIGLIYLFFMLIDVVSCRLSPETLPQRRQDSSQLSRPHSHVLIALVPIIIICVGVFSFLVTVRKDQDLEIIFGAYTNWFCASLRGPFVTRIISIFSHGSTWHILLNMVSLLAIGPGLVRKLGPLHFWAFFVSSGLGASISSDLWNISVRTSNIARHWGASGAISALMSALCLYEDTSFYLLGFRATRAHMLFYYIYGNFIILAYDLLPEIGSAAHIGGIIFGLVLFKPLCAFWDKRRTIFRCIAGV